METINIGAAANDGSGDDLRTAMGKVNTNFTALVGKNLLINPNFIVNQAEYVEGADLAPDAYCYDMWKSYDAGSTNNGVSVSGEIITFDPDTELTQISDDLIALDGETVTASIQSGSCSCGDSNELQVITPGNPHTFTLNATATDGFRVLSGGGGFSGLKLEVGAVVTAYQHPQITEEELKCCRYFYRINGYGTGMYTYRAIAQGYGLMNMVTGQLRGGMYQVSTPVKMRDEIAIDDSNITYMNILGYSGAPKGNLTVSLVTHGFVELKLTGTDDAGGNYQQTLIFSGGDFDLDARY